MFKMTLRELFLLITLAGVGTAWWLDRSRLAAGPDWKSFDQYKADYWEHIRVVIDEIEERERNLGLKLPRIDCLGEVQYFPEVPEFSLSDAPEGQKYKDEEMPRLR
jgi:hypothetical protein